MDELTVEAIKRWINVAAVVMAVSLVLSGILLAAVVRQIKKRRLPAGAGLVATLQVTPFMLVLALDLLDLALDFLAAPIAWVILGYLGLDGLRGFTVVESLIPGTQLLPTLTLCWIVARLMPDRLGYLLKSVNTEQPPRAEKRP